MIGQMNSGAKRFPEWTHAVYIRRRKSNLDNAINALVMLEYDIENAGHDVLDQVLDPSRRRV
jgi:hypothetical protein